MIIVPIFREIAEDWLYSNWWRYFRLRINWSHYRKAILLPAIIKQQRRWAQANVQIQSAANTSLAQICSVQHCQWSDFWYIRRKVIGAFKPAFYSIFCRIQPTETQNEWYFQQFRAWLMNVHLNIKKSILLFFGRTAAGKNSALTILHQPLQIIHRIQKLQWHRHGPELPSHFT